MDFGFGITPSSRINLDEVDIQAIQDIAKEDPGIQECMACGTCSAVCTAGKYTDNSLRRAILAVQNGQFKKAEELLQGCLLCGKCTMVCPRGINTRHLILTITKRVTSK